MTFNRDAFIGLFVLGLVLLGLFWYVATHPAPTPGTGFLPQGQNNVVDRGPQQITETADWYAIDAKYPGTTPLSVTAGAEAEANAVLLMKTFEEGQIERFKGDLAGYDAEYRQFLAAEGRKASLSIDYVGFASPKTLSYVYGMVEDTLGAHPNSYYRTFTFDLATGEVLHLGDLFEDPNYLQTLSTLSRERLPADLASRAQITVDQVDMDMLNAGTAPYEDNFINFYIDGEEFVLLFPPYQIAAYVYGSSELRFPKAELPGFSAEYR